MLRRVRGSQQMTGDAIRCRKLPIHQDVSATAATTTFTTLYVIPTSRTHILEITPAWQVHETVII